MSGNVEQVAVGEEALEGAFDEVQAFFASAEAFYKLLSSIYYLELTEDQIAGLAAAGFAYPDDGSEMARACKEIRTYLKRRGANARQDLAVDYARIFLAAGVYEGETAVPFESVYTSKEGILMQDSRDDVVRIYAANGLRIPRELNVPEDHLAFELEFVAHMSERIAATVGNDKADAEGLARTQLAFIDEHLLNWIPQLAQRVEKYAKLAFYPAVMTVTRCFIDENRSVLLELLAD